MKANMSTSQSERFKLLKRSVRSCHILLQWSFITRNLRIPSGTGI